MSFNHQKPKSLTCDVFPAMGCCQPAGRNCLKWAVPWGFHDAVRHTVLTKLCPHPLCSHSLLLCFVPVEENRKNKTFRHNHTWQDHLTGRPGKNLCKHVPVLNFTYLFQIPNEELFAVQHFFLISLSQLVKICKLMQRRVAACERRRRWEQERVEGNQLTHIQLTLPVDVMT